MGRSLLVSKKKTEIKQGQATKEQGQKNNNKGQISREKTGTHQAGNRLGQSGIIKDFFFLFFAHDCPCFVIIALYCPCCLFFVCAVPVLSLIVPVLSLLVPTVPVLSLLSLFRPFFSLFCPCLSLFCPCFPLFCPWSIGAYLVFCQLKKNTNLLSWSVESLLSMGPTLFCC